MTTKLEAQLVKIQGMEKELIERLKTLREEEGLLLLQLKECTTARFNSISDLQGDLNREKDTLFIMLQKE